MGVFMSNPGESEKSINETIRLEKDSSWIILLRLVMTRLYQDLYDCKRKGFIDENYLTDLPFCMSTRKEAQNSLRWYRKLFHYRLGDFGYCYDYERHIELNTGM